jgi:hypothetical protein
LVKLLFIDPFSKFFNQKQTAGHSIPTTKTKWWFLLFSLVFPADAAENSFTASHHYLSSIALGTSQTIYLIGRRPVKKLNDILAKKAKVKKSNGTLAQRSEVNIKHSVDWAIENGMIPTTKWLSEPERQSYIANAIQRIKKLLANHGILDLNYPGEPIILDVKKANKIFEKARKAENRSPAQQTQDILKAFYDQNKQLVESTYAQEINEKKTKGIKTNWKSYLSAMQKNPNKCPNLITYISLMHQQKTSVSPVASVPHVESLSPEGSLPAKQLATFTSMPLVKTSLLRDKFFENHALDGENEKNLEFFINNVSQDLGLSTTIDNPQNLSSLELVSYSPGFEILCNTYEKTCKFVNNYSSTICDKHKTPESRHQTDIVQTISKIASYQYENYLEQGLFNRCTPLHSINTRVSIVVVTNSFWTQPSENYTKILFIVIPYLVILPFSHLIMNILSIKGKESSSFKNSVKDLFIDNLKRYDISCEPSKNKKFVPIALQE